MKRFYKEVAARVSDGGFELTLDGRLVRTPAGETLRVPSSALARALAGEWSAQRERIEPATMPLTSLAYTALDRVAPNRDDVVAEVAAFGASDLLCYRAEEPDSLVALQSRQWDPYLKWAADALSARLVITHGIMPVTQNEGALAALYGHVDALDSFRLTALHGLTSGLGSLVLGLAAQAGFRDMAAIWDASRVDEDFQADSWGRDAESETVEAHRRADVEAAFRFDRLVIAQGNQNP